MMNLEEIKKSISKITDVEIIKIVDNSSKHNGHSGVMNSINELTHIQIFLSNKFNLSRVNLHRKIYSNLDYFIKKGLHSIEIKEVR